jgi:hypothetical protein
MAKIDPLKGDVKCHRLPAHKGEHRSTLHAAPVVTVKAKPSAKSIMAKVNRRNQPKAVRGNYKFVVIGGTKFRCVVGKDGSAVMTKVVKTLRPAVVERQVAASSKTTKRASFRTSGKPNMTRPAVG